jgi:hypothetical protein
VRYVEWIEPFWGSEPVYMRVSESTAIGHQRAVARQSNHEYGNDQDALDDFLSVHWAQIVKPAKTCQLDKLLILF